MGQYALEIKIKCPEELVYPIKTSRDLLLIDLNANAPPIKKESGLGCH